MANFNKVKHKGPNAVTHEGGNAYEKSPVDEWLNFLFSSFMEDKFYEASTVQQKRFLDLTQKMCDNYGPTFVAKAAVFARNELGMRSVSQLVAAWLNTQTFETKRAFYKAFMHRPDDVAEIFAAIDFLENKRSHALIRGTADYLSGISASTLAKYKLSSRNYNMFDLINITHANSDAINQYKKNELEQADTWEVKISTAADSEARQQEWKRLVEQHKLGYMALIRNLNNILACKNIDREWVQTYLVPQITAESAIKRSLMFPYRFYTAYRNLKVRNDDVVYALGQAFTIACKTNAPQLEGTSGILLDVSGSMEDHISSKSNITIKEVGACFAVGLYIANPKCKIVKFGTNAKTVQLNLLDNPFEMIKKLCNNDNCGYGTEINPAFEVISRCGKATELDRMFIISDMQVMDANGRMDWYNMKRGKSAIEVYHKKFGMLPAYSFDLGHYHTQVLSPTDHIRYVTALNDQVFKFIGLLESGINLVDYINSFTYC